MLARNLERLGRIAADPGAAWTRFCTRLEARRDYRRQPPVYRPDPDWEARLHRRLGLARPCAAAAEFAELWPRVAARVAELGCRFGPQSYYGWNDGDPELVRAVWCLVRHLRPARVVETGVAHGVTTRFILEAMERNGAGTLWSIDLPPNGPRAAAEIGIAVDGCAPGRWRLLQGSSRRLLPKLLEELGTIDLFIHDSLHTERHVRFEVETARRHLKPGGFIVVDDIDTNWGLHALMAAPQAGRTLICQSEPVVPDRRRFDDRGLFAIIEPAPG